MARKRKNKKKGLSSLLQINSKGRKVKNSTRVMMKLGQLKRMVNAARKNRRVTVKARVR